jgi:hypothetical protein
MDKTAIKNYAMDARRKLTDAVSQKANQLYIFETGDKSIEPGKDGRERIFAKAGTQPVW